MSDFIKETMRPSSVTFMLALLTAGAALLNVSALARWGRRWLTAVVVLYWVLSCPITVKLLARTLTTGYEPVTSQQVSGAQAIVLLGAGSWNVRAAGQQLPIVTLGTGLRALEAARVYRMIGNPLLIVSGGITDHGSDAAPESEAMRRALLDLAVPSDRIVSESVSKNTREEAIIVTEILRARHISRFVLVTSPLHMRRSTALFAAQGMHPVPAIAPLEPDRPDRAESVLPNDRALWIGDAMVYEWAALAYYWLHGWL